LPTISIPQLAYRAGRGVRWLLRRTLVGVRLLVIVYFLIGPAPAPARVIPYPPQTVQTQHPLICVHTRLTDEVEDPKIQLTLQMVREMGAATIVDFLPWAYIEGSPGQYDWHHADRIIDMAQQEGIDVIVRLGLVPGWARPDPNKQQTSLNYLAPDRYADYARFVAAFASRYHGKVTKIIPWNEPNLSFEWGYRQVTPEDYVQFLKLVYEAAHAANPDIMILGGALAPTIEPPGSPNGMDDIIFLRRMVQAGGSAYFDALAVHTYGFTQPPETDPAPDLLNFRRFELLHEVMAQFGDADKPIYITESGWNDHPRWTKAVGAGHRLEYTLNAFRLVEKQWPTVKNLCLWYFRTPLPVLSYPDYFALVTTDFRIKPIYTAIRAYAQGREDTP
jgi:hypothetical protein